MNRQLGRLVAATCALLPAVLLGVQPSAAADDDEETKIIVADGTVCWELVKQPDCFGTILLSRPAPVNLTVKVHTEDGTATAPEDYAEIAGLVVLIPAGDTSARIPLSIVPDKLDEDDEWFDLVITDPSYGVIAGDRASVTIHNGAP